jgi:AcrR family transcriptional regulator
VSRQSVYNHFETRSNLFTLALVEAGEEFAERVASYLAKREGTPLELVVEAILIIRGSRTSNRLWTSYPPGRSRSHTIRSDR